MRPYTSRITLRGDTDFTLSGELDRWDREGVKFIFGMDAHPKVVQLAEALPQKAWKRLERLPRYEIATKTRRKADRIKEEVVRIKGYQNQVLMGESVAEMELRRFPHAIVLVPAQIVRAGRRIIYRIMSYNPWLKDLFAAWEHLRRLRLVT